MKRFVILLMALLAGACHRSMSPWSSEEEEGEDVAVYVRTRNMYTPFAADYQFFVENKQTGKITSHTISSDGKNNDILHLRLPVGSYTGYCITNASDESLWEYNEDATPEQIYLKTPKNTEDYKEARDYLLGECNFEVKGNGNSSAVFNLTRKVGMLKVTIENIPEWLPDLEINLSNIPQKMNLKGEYTGTCTVTKSVGPPVNGTAELSLLVFPPTKKATLTLSSDTMVYMSPDHTLDSLLPNHITEIKAIFKAAPENMDIDFTTNLAEWEEQIIREDDWEVDLPDGICTGSGNGINLVRNGDFEDNYIGYTPDYWTLDASKKDNPKKAIIVGSPVQHGQQAIMTEGKTYIYQDIPVEGGRCYQLNLYVYAPETDAKWKYWGTWMKGSTDFPDLSTSLRSETYEKQNAGYVDVYQGKLFRAPSNANKLRIEVRNYGDPVSGKGIYIDNVSVQAVD